MTTIQFSKAQFAQFEAIEEQRALEDGLRRFETDLVGEDPELHGQVEAYRQTHEWSMWLRIVTLTSIGLYQRSLLAICLQSGMDVTTDPTFAYIVDHPALSGNTKARHIILMVMAFHRMSEGL